MNTATARRLAARDAPPPPIVGAPVPEAARAPPRLASSRRARLTGTAGSLDWADARPV